MDNLNFSDDIILKALDGCLSEEEQKIFQELGEKDSDFKIQYEQMSRMWHYGKYAGKWHQLNETKAWDQIVARRSKKFGRKWLGWSIAASVVLFLGVSVFSLINRDYIGTTQETVTFSNNKSGAYLVLSSGERVPLDRTFEQVMLEEGVVIQGDSSKLVYEGKALDSREKYNELVIPRGGEYQLSLSDGTIVYLNADSRLKYPVSFGEDCRLVELDGEGYFEVAHDAKRPFIVRTQELDVNVLGTGFNVLSYKEDGEVAVTLVHGKVAVKETQKQIVLKPDEQLVFNKHNKEINVQKVDARTIAAWTKGTMVFDSMPLSELAVKLTRWFDVDFFFTSEKLKHLKFTGTFKKYSDIEYILSLIEATTNISLSLKGNTIVVENK